MNSFKIIISSISFSLLILISSCEKSNHSFRIVDSSKSNITFNNEIIETDSFNVLTYEHLYNGAGVAIADFNNDSLQDIFFAGNLVGNELYLNEGNFSFRNVSEISKIAARDKWCSGVSVVDINADGLKDIYVCATLLEDSVRRENILFVNQGMNEEGIPTFLEMAADYGINDNSYSTNAAFFDYDNDGDLDLYIIKNKIESAKNPNVYKSKARLVQERIDKLYRNDWDGNKGHPFFKDVSSEAGIQHEGYSLGINVSDINQDGWKDIYITNDYMTQDLAYINQKDGTFKNMSEDYFQHTSQSAMGNDISDINNDGYPDIIVLDMMPEDNYRKKTMLPPNNYNSYVNNEKYGYQYQYMRNTLQLNKGIEPSSGNPVFSEIGIVSGISSTDWSWAPLIADFDNDGLRDIIITNGFPRDVTDRDYIEYNSDVGTFASKGMLLERIPSVKLKNYAYRNVGDGKFEDVTESWAIIEPSFSNGAAFGDLDNDGDIDYVVNNINDPAYVYQNLTNDKKTNESNWVKLKLNGNKQNPDALGAIVKVYPEGGKILYWEHNIYRGYLSTVEDNVHFGLGKNNKVDSILVYWPNATIQKVYNPEINKLISLDINDASFIGTIDAETNHQTILKSANSDLGINYTHEDADFIDFNFQPLLPHKLSQYGPSISIGDVNGDGLDDIYTGGSHFQAGVFFIQNEDGTFRKEFLFNKSDLGENEEEELGTLLFDADGDGDLDLYTVSGGYEFEINHRSYQDRFFENVGGNFLLNKAALPEFLSSGSCVKAADFDRDGDLDLFVGGRVMPREYPKPVSSQLLLNNSEKGSIKFSLANEDKAPMLNKMGMVTDALWSDFNNDGWVDLIISGEWMPLTFLMNKRGKLEDVTSSTGIGDQTGWWNSISSGDFDKDGDTDYIAGNLGQNTFFKASAKHPVSIYAADFDGNKGYDIIPTAYFENIKGKLEEFPFFGRLDLQKQITKVKDQFGKHDEFAQANINEILNPEQIDSALVYRANNMNSSYIENLGNGKFKMRDLPINCQVAPVFGILTDDFNLDGNLDVALVGNDYGAELTVGRYDAFFGVMLYGDGKGNFDDIPIQESGLYVPGDAKALVQLINKSGENLIIASQNKDEIKVFQNIKKGKVISLISDDFYMIIEKNDGSKAKYEFYYGNSYLSQSSRRISLPNDVMKVEIVNFKGEKRAIDLTNQSI